MPGHGIGLYIVRLRNSMLREVVAQKSERCEERAKVRIGWEVLKEIKEHDIATLWALCDMTVRSMIETRAERPLQRPEIRLGQDHYIVRRADYHARQWLLN